MKKAWNISVRETAMNPQDRKQMRLQFRGLPGLRSVWFPPPGQFSLFFEKDIESQGEEDS